jgi:hypothetical protein
MFSPRKIKLIVAMIFFLALGSALSVGAQDSLTMNFWFGTASGYPNQQNAIIPVFVENFSDSVSGFLIWIQLNRPDMIYFNGTTDDLIDTSGTLISGWNYVNARSVGGTGHDIQIVGLASGIPPQPYVAPFGPQSGEIPLVKIKADVYDVPDTASDRFAELFVTKNFSAFQFSDQAGQMIGLKYDTLYDTSWFQCQQWAPPPNDTICLSWMQVAGPPADSITVDTSLVPTLDTNMVIIMSGLFVIHQCGDANGNGTINILDGTFLINYLYRQGPPPPALLAGDANGNGLVNILDVTFLIEFLYRGGTTPIYYR